MIKNYKYQISEDDFIDFQLHYLKMNSKANKTIKMTIIILISLYVIVFAAMAIYFRDNAFLILIIAALVSAFSVIQIFTYRKRLEKKIVNKVKEYVKSGKLDKVLGNKALEIYDNKIVFYEDRGTSSFNKENIKNIESSTKSVLIYIDEMSAIIVPKHYLKDEDIDFLLSYNKNL